MSGTGINADLTNSMTTKMKEIRSDRLSTGSRNVSQKVMDTRKITIKNTKCNEDTRYV